MGRDAQCGGTRLRFVRSIHAPKPLIAAGPVAYQYGSVRCSWAIFSRAATTHSVTECKETGRGDETPLPARAYHALRVHKSQPSPKNAFTSQECTKGKGRMRQPPQDALLLYYDDVSSSPRPQAHWYMLTHRATATRLPDGPRIALH